MREIWSPRPPISMSSQSAATGAWAWASLGGRAWASLGLDNLFFLFFAPPPQRSPVPGTNCWRLRTHCQFHEHVFLFFAPPPSLGSGPGARNSRDYGFHCSNSTTTSYIPLVCLKTQLSAPASTCMYCRLYVVRVDTYTVWSQWWSVEECLDLMT